ncbi:MAG: formate--tetrahydrofolate ligase [Candidatus Nanopelagicales bacterium]|nr:formate--tetrahydrofolate ligase [Candidatus Nanopelagicales bacterium]
MADPRPALRPIVDVAEELGIAPQHVIPWGPDRAKVHLDALGERTMGGRLILVSAITPTPAGEGKTTMAIALAMGMRAIGRRAVLALREPSLGPVFGMKGGGTGGGRATLEPAEDINLHFTGDLHAITSAHNLLSALVDNTLQFGQPAPLDHRRVTWPRAVDMNDRFLRHVLVGLGGPLDGIPREAGFQITASSEVMAVLCLARDLPDLQARLGRIVVGWTSRDEPVTADDIHAAPAMTALLRDALMPNLAQAADGSPALVHGGPFANIAHGTNSMIATRMALATGADVITEGGFGFDLGGEKFLDIACRSAGIWPRAVVLVATLRALKYHGGAPLSDAPKPDREALRAGLRQLERHLFSVGAYGLPPIVALNRFPADVDEEVELLRAWCSGRGVAMAPCTGFTDGAEGSTELAEVVGRVVDATDARVPQPWHPYDPDAAYPDKIAAVARHVYGADGIEVAPAAAKELARITAAVGTDLPVCIAKTHLSLSDDAGRLGVPHGFTVNVREARLAAGAGFVVASTGSIVTMPGLPREPAALHVRVQPDGRIRGLMAGERS